MRKGQVTIFMIIGIIIVALLALIFAFREGISEQAKKVEMMKTITMTKEARTVQSNMEQCMGSLTELGLVVLGLQGGYTTIDTKIHHTETSIYAEYVPYYGTAYHYFKGQSLVPTKEIMEEQLSGFIEENSLVCEEQYPGLDIDYGNMNAEVEIEDDDIKINAESEVRVKKEEKESGFDSISIEVPVRLGMIQGITTKMVDQQIKVSEEDICVSCIVRIAAENDMEVSIDRVGEDIFYMITDKKSKVLGYDYIFLLANKF